MRSSERDVQFQEFVAARAEGLRRFAFLMCGDWHRAEDAVQTGLARLYAVWPRVSGSPVDAYARRTVLNVILAERRRSWFRRERSSYAVPEPPPDTPTDSSAVRMTVLSALASLPPRQRAAVVLRYWEDLSVERAAEVLRCSPGTVKSQTARGLQTLRGLLDENLSRQA